MTVSVVDNPRAERYELTAEDERIGFLTYRIQAGGIDLLAST